MLRRAIARSVSATGEEVRLRITEGPLAARDVPAVFYPGLGDPPRPGEKVVANTLGIEMGLGTGGVAIVLPSRGGNVPENRDHFVKLPYTPLQFPAPPPPQAQTLGGVPVVVLPLHSHLAPACCAAAALRPGCRTAFVWQEGGALPVRFSRTVEQLRGKELLHCVVSVGSCFGGDVEAPNIYSGMLAAAERADLVLAGIGPGVVGTASPYGHGGMAAAIALNAACSMEAEPVLAPRISSADPRERHRGVSHHTRAALSAALAGCRVAFPEAETGGALREALPERHACCYVPFGASGLEERFGVTFESMGRRYSDDRAFFDAPAAAVALALGEGGDV